MHVEDHDEVRIYHSHIACTVSNIIRVWLSWITTAESTKFQSTRIILFIFCIIHVEYICVLEEEDFWERNVFVIEHWLYYLTNVT